MIMIDDNNQRIMIMGGQYNTLSGFGRFFQYLYTGMLRLPCAKIWQVFDLLKMRVNQYQKGLHALLMQY